MCKSSLEQSRHDDPEDRTRNSAIKLFGKTILVQFPDEIGNGSAEDRGSSSTVDEFVQSEIAGLKRPPTDVLQQNRKVKCSTVENLADEKKNSQPPESLNGARNGEKLERSPPKPEKVVACPRCQSLNTKFCYFNNYNVNQPRHFCKNCRRYWTDGGTMRNIPVGAGRRKSKNFIALNQHLQMQKLKEENVIIAGDTFKNDLKNTVESTCGSSVITAAAAIEIRKDACFEEIDGANSITFASGFPAFGSDSGNPIIINAPNNLISAESSVWIPNTVRIESSSAGTRGIPVLESLGLCTGRAFPACVQKNDVK